MLSGVEVCTLENISKGRDKSDETEKLQRLNNPKDSQDNIRTLGIWANYIRISTELCYIGVPV